MLRDMLVEFGLSRLSFAWLLIRPVLIIGALYLVTVAIRTLRPPQGMEVLVFIASGYVSWLAFMRCFSDLPGSVRSARGLMMFPHLTQLDLLVARAAVDWAVYTSVFFTLVGLGLLFERASLPADAFGVLLPFFACVWMGACLGIIITVVERFTDALSMFMIVIRRVGIFVSGVLFAASSLPSWVLGWVSWNPIFHCLEIIRESWWPAYRSPIADPVYVAQCVFFMTAVALVLERFTRRWSR